MNDKLFGTILDSPDQPFALVYRPTRDEDRLDVLAGDVVSVDRLADVPLPEGKAGPGTDALVMVPYRQVAERGFASQDDGAPLLVLRVREQGGVAVGTALDRIPDTTLGLRNAGFDIGDGEYGDIVRRVLTDEIGRGVGANFVIKRSFVAEIEDYSLAKALAVFRRLLVAEQSAYWTFLVHTGDRTFVGATPERHVTLDSGVSTMNPISGTYRYPDTGATLPEVLDFLADRKETEELYMVVDEELKMMGRICDDGARVLGPYLKEMARVAHTEYLIEGRTDRDAREILRETMFAPTVTGSPLESAFRVINRYEPEGRGYYSGIAALVGSDETGAQTLDSAILIRTAEISAAGELNLGVGATLVRHSDPDSEIAETQAKARAMLSVLGWGEDGPAEIEPAAVSIPAVAFEPPALMRRRKKAAPPAPRPEARPELRAHPDVLEALESRNETLSTFWFTEDAARMKPHADLAGRRVLVVDAEDTFTAMLGNQIRALGLVVDIHRFDDLEVFPETRGFRLDGYDLVLMGPGPGDPRELTDHKISRLREITREVRAREIPMLAVCLGHQVLSGLLGFELVRKEVPNQGLQQVIDLFGRRARVGFYNTFASVAEGGRVRREAVSGEITVSRDARTGEVHALSGPGFRSVQFHPESLLTQDGPAILADLIGELLPAPSALIDGGVMPLVGLWGEPSSPLVA